MKIIQYPEQDFNISVKVSKNNTFLTLSNSKGEVLALQSTGVLKFSGKRSNNKVAGISIIGLFVKNIKEKFNLTNVSLSLNGWGPTRKPILNFLFRKSKLKFTFIKEISAIPFNGCRKEKKKKKKRKIQLFRRRWVKKLSKVT